MGLKKMMVMLLLIITQIIYMCEALDFGGKTTHVQITNFIGITTWLTVHCKSGDNDLGGQALRPMASYEFKFKTTFKPFGNTFFLSSFEWPGAYHTYEIYNQKTAKYAQNCWVIKTSGPCLCDCKNTSCTFTEDCYNWDP